MISSLFAPLRETLRPHFDLSKTRLETLAVLLFGLANGRTVNLSHVASQFPGEALQASNDRRLQRFFQYVRLDGDRVAQLIVGMLNLSRSKLLALDRTNWKLGARDVNILVLAIVTRRFRVPLLWTPINHQGNSSTPQRTALMRRYLALFEASSIKMLLADREFIGACWMTFLVENDIPFAIRLKEGMLLHLEDGRRLKFSTLLRKSRRSEWTGWLSGMAKTPQNRLHFAAKRIKGGERLIIATNTSCPNRALQTYRKRWGIECLFGDTKTRGFNPGASTSRTPTSLILKSSKPCSPSSLSPWHGPIDARQPLSAGGPSAEKSTEDGKNLGFAPGSTPCDDGSSTTQKRQSKHGKPELQNIHQQKYKTRESCTVAPIHRIGSIILIGRAFEPENRSHFS